MSVYKNFEEIPKEYNWIEPYLTIEDLQRNNTVEELLEVALRNKTQKMIIEKIEKEEREEEEEFLLQVQEKKVKKSNNKTIINFATYIGQEDVIKKIKIFIPAALKDNSPLPHMLFRGGGGLGKTSMATALAEEMGRTFVTTTGENLSNNKDVDDLFSHAFSEGATDNPIIFIDEVHQMTKGAQEAFYTALEDGIFYRKERGVISTLPVPPFTFIAGTTNPEKLTKPFLSRMVLDLEFKPYTLENSMKIAMLWMKHNKLSKTGERKEEVEVASEIAKRSKGVARNITNHCYKLKNFAVSKDDKSYKHQTVLEYFDFFGVDENGLEKRDYRILQKLYQQHPEPIGANFLSHLVGEPQLFIEEYIEPWLLALELVERTKKGRIITKKGIKLLTSKGMAKEITASW